MVGVNILVADTDEEAEHDSLRINDARRDHKQAARSTTRRGLNIC